jgi:hypothetical protein
MPQNWLGHFAVAAWASAFRSILVGRESRRVDSQFDKVPDADVFFQNGMWDLESLALFGVHGNTIYQLIAVGESLLLELLFQIFRHGSD